MKCLRPRTIMAQQQLLKVPCWKCENCLKRKKETQIKNSIIKQKEANEKRTPYKQLQIFDVREHIQYKWKVITDITKDRRLYNSPLIKTKNTLL